MTAEQPRLRGGNGEGEVCVPRRPNLPPMLTLRYRPSAAVSAPASAVLSAASAAAK